MAFKNLSVSKELSGISSASFVAVGSAVSAPYVYGDDIVIPYLEGILFAGVVSKTKKETS